MILVLMEKIFVEVIQNDKLPLKKNTDFYGNYITLSRL